DDILDLSKIEAGRMELAPTPRDFHHILRRQLRLWLPRAEEKGIALTLEIDDSVMPFMLFDAVRVGQCVSNMVSNAIKFTEQGEVAIKVSARTVPQGTAVTLTVRDTGMGMSKA